MQIRKEKSLMLDQNTLDIKSKYHQHFVFTLEFRMKYYPVQISTSANQPHLRYVLSEPWWHTSSMTADEIHQGMFLSCRNYIKSFFFGEGHHHHQVRRRAIPSLWASRKSLGSRISAFLYCDYACGYPLTNYLPSLVSGFLCYKIKIMVFPYFP